jgi:hypothetical protein
MTSRARRRDWEILGLEPGADLGKVKRAHHYRRSLYDPGSLATYTLLDDSERKQMLSRIDEAYWRIVGIEPSPSRIDVSNRSLRTDQTEIPSGPAPDAATEPGAHLRHHKTRISWPFRPRYLCADIFFSSLASSGHPPSMSWQCTISPKCAPRGTRTNPHFSPGVYYGR